MTLNLHRLLRFIERINGKSGPWTSVELQEIIDRKRRRVRIELNEIAHFEMLKYQALKREREYPEHLR